MRMKTILFSAGLALAAPGLAQENNEDLGAVAADDERAAALPSC